ncbi:hypothetical protein [Sphingobium sp. CR28]|uniref:hypothetical protein n=1 Tax=Sphingobium sp. CR28 TaxID=3400272 RepID=UPI003FEEDFBF
MRTSAKRRPITAPMLCVALSAIALASCGKSEESPTKKVEMRDMEAVDGTISDAMTDLDAVQVDGTALANNAAGSTAPASARRKTREADDEAEQDAETVPVE